MKLLLSLLFVLILITGGCTGDTIQVEEDQIIGEVNQNQMSIFNSSDQSIYYAVFDRSILAYIKWAPTSSDENKMPGFNKKTFQVTDILAGEETNGTIVFYFWTDKNPDGETLKFVTFEIGE